MSAVLIRKLSQAQERLQAGDAAAAQRLCEEVLARAPRNPDALCLLGITLLMTARPRDAIKPLTQALAAQPRHGAALENRVKQSFGGENGGKRLLPPGVEVAFDSGKVGTTNLHTINVDQSGTDAAESLGTSLELTLAVAPEYAFLMAGGDPRQRLATVLGPDGKADPQAKPIVGVDVSVPRVLT